MRNKKLKHIEKTMRLNVLEKARDEDYCGVWLALLDSGISRSRVLKLFDDFHEKAVPTYQRDAVDGALQIRLDSFLRNVDIPPEMFEQVVKRHHAEISAMFTASEAYQKAISANTTDFMVLMHYVHIMLGFGHKRLMRVIDYIMSYNGDARREVNERLGIEYAADNELAYSIEVLKKPKQRIDISGVKQARRDMEAISIMEAKEEWKQMSRK